MNQGKSRRFQGKTAPGMISAALFLLAGLSIASPPHANAQEVISEYQVKAAYLFNFLKFVEWPSDAFSDPLAPIIIGITGDDQFVSTLQQIVLGKTVQDRDVIIRKYRPAEDLRSCQILFISPSEEKRLPHILESLRGSSVLTVSDIDRFVESGGMIQFKMENSRVRFSIGLAAAERARLKISSKLLAVAQAVSTGKE